MGSNFLAKIVTGMKSVTFFLCLSIFQEKGWIIEWYKRTKTLGVYESKRLFYPDSALNQVVLFMQVFQQYEANYIFHIKL
jgi:hypothetical protein